MLETETSAKFLCSECNGPAWIEVGGGTEADGKYLCRKCYAKLQDQRFKRLKEINKEQIPLKPEFIPDDVIDNGVDDYPPLDRRMPRTVRDAR